MSVNRRLRSEPQLYLIGDMHHQIVGEKLPSNRQVLSVFYYNVREYGFTTSESARIVASEVFVFWDKARINKSAEWYCIKKIKKLYEKVRELQKPTKKY